MDELSVTKMEATNAVNAKAEQVRLAYVTGGSGQALMYVAKILELERWDAHGDVQLCPVLVAEAEARNITPDAMAEMWRATMAGWWAVAAEIEGRRVAALLAIEAAESEAEAWAGAGLFE